MSAEITFSVSDFVAVFNQTISYAYPTVTIVGELSSFKISKNRWVYFNLKDDIASVRFFGTVYQLNGPLEDGMMLTVTGVPQLHPQFGFSITVQSVQLSGEGTIKRAQQLLAAKLEAEGLFDESRKRVIAFPPASIGLVASRESAAYADFMKILNERWGGIEVQLYDVQVQGEDAPVQIVEAIEYFNSHATPPEALVVTRGGGSAEDLQAFNTEPVTRAVAASRIPTMVAIGHEVDISLAELAADKRASTPSNAAEMLVPDRTEVKQTLRAYREQTAQSVHLLLQNERQTIHDQLQIAGLQLTHELRHIQQTLHSTKQILELLHPAAILKRGYAIVRISNKVLRSTKQAKVNSELSIQLHDGSLLAVLKGKVQ